MIVVEGALEIPASLRLLQSVGIPHENLRPVDKGGRNTFWKHISKYNQVAANVGPVLGLADMDAHPCASGLIRDHLGTSRHPDLVLRIAERMLESWFLADSGLADFLGVSADLLPSNPESESNPKQTVVNLARRSRSRNVRADLVPETGSLGVVGKGYTPRMTEFIERHWSPTEAQKRSESLRRALAAIRRAIES